MKKIFISAIAILAAITGCNKIETPAVTDDGTMRFNVAHPATKAT